MTSATVSLTFVSNLPKHVAVLWERKPLNHGQEFEIYSHILLWAEIYSHILLWVESSLNVLTAKIFLWRSDTWHWCNRTGCYCQVGIAADSSAVPSQWEMQSPEKSFLIISSETLTQRVSDWLSKRGVSVTRYIKHPVTTHCQQTISLNRFRTDNNGTQKAWDC
jgi:hypothetical protein